MMSFTSLDLLFEKDHKQLKGLNLTAEMWLVAHTFALAARKLERSAKDEGLSVGDFFERQIQKVFIDLKKGSDEVRGRWKQTTGHDYDDGERVSL